MRRTNYVLVAMSMCALLATSCANELETGAPEPGPVADAQLLALSKEQPAPAQDGGGYTATLTITADWRTGYCAVVKVRSTTDDTLNAWSVALDLHGTEPWGFWGAQTTRDNARVTATPWQHDGARGRATELFGFCARRSDPRAVATIVPPALDTTTRLSVAVYVPRVIDTCFIGDPCEPGSADCTGLVAPGEVLVEGFTSDSFAAVRPTSPRREGANKEICLALTMSDADYASVLAELDKVREVVRSWSHGDIELDLHVMEFDRVDLDLTRWGGGFWVGPWDFKELALSRLDFLPDFNLVLAPVGDPVKNLSHWIGGCGGAFGVDLGIAGGGYAWIPKSTSLNYDCGTQPTITHEWLHQVHYAYDEVSQFGDLYGDQLPACGAGDPDPKRWFPDSHQCLADPDFPACGSADCGGNDLVNAHILSEHWDPTFAFVANHCKDARQDYDETGVDSGPSCLGTATAQRALLTARGSPLPTP